MSRWRPQHYLRQALDSGADATVAGHAARTGAVTVARHPDRPPVLSLRHLSHMADVPYKFLRAIVSRNGFDHYRLFRIHKRVRTASKRYRVICIPDPALLHTQRWIAQNILRTVTPHYASTAFAQGDNIVSAAQVHHNARWLIKLDVENFFESITEISAYRVFLSLGYQPLVSFELARLCTRVRRRGGICKNPRWRSRSWNYQISTYCTEELGYLPQGAPTSPMLSNLSMAAFDDEVDAIATTHGLRYSRYADDISLSTPVAEFSRGLSAKVVRAIYKTMVQHGLSPNRAKTQIRSPGCRKIVLGLLVDGSSPRLTREFKSRVRMHLYYLNHPEFGPVRHAEHRGFDSIIGLQAHVRGLIAHAQLVEPEYAAARLAEFNNVVW